MSHIAPAQVIEIPVNMNGTLRVNVPTNMSAEQVQGLALERFRRMLNEELLLGEAGEASCQFDGAVWGTEGQAQVGELMFEVQHDMALNVSGAAVALRPRDGEFGANRFRSRVCAYVAEHEVYVTAADPSNGSERVLVTARMEGGDVIVHVMDPSGDDAYMETGMTPIASIPFPGLASALN
ncbi:hypothetical protein EGJ28_21180 [Stutzerimonas xanthomarina]|uniref:Uncharacterized protein n=1 Tax=Stutzerimonas xanthomarina TaxID=271420 RepID=A0A427DPI7_9GAMM|nr:hypothetical protein [Stutzerimonas xanthomarina]RRV05454.1 hypothetical protein EGJ28_21180 [Stutzerimonas xanthomarina]